jgi:hypothetical protein
VIHRNQPEWVDRVHGTRTRREFSIGDTVTVSLDRVADAEKRLQFSMEEPVRKRGKGKRTVNENE